MRRLFFISLLLIQPAMLLAQQSAGSIGGRVLDAATGEALIGVNVIVMDTTLGAATDALGEFLIEHVPPGVHTMQFRFMGYKHFVLTDVDVRPGRTVFVQAELKETVLETGEVVLTASSFSGHDDAPVSALGFNREEVRRAPGSGGDISRVLQSLPSTAQVADNSNDLMVRGGSPFENGYYVDRILVPNINHFPTQGASGGAMGIINVDLIDEVTFLTGGFPAAYGDRLSSVVDIRLRDGSTRSFEGQLDLSVAGFGGVLEGPLPAGMGSWLFSARRSYLDFVSSFTTAGSTAPRYGDIHAKMTIEASVDHRIEFLNIFGESLSGYDRQDAIDNGVNFYGDYDSWQNTSGISWRWLHGNSGYTTTSLSWSAIHFNNDAFEVTSSAERSRNASAENAIRLRSSSMHAIARGHQVEAGIDAALSTFDYSAFVSPFLDSNGSMNPGLETSGVFRDRSVGAFATYNVTPVVPLTCSFGLRADWFGYTEALALSPRVAAAWRLSDIFAINCAVGVYHQQLPMVLLTQDERNRSLPPTRAVHFVLGAEYMLTAYTRLVIEAYRKDYSSFPMAPSDPLRFVIDDGRYDVHFGSYGKLEGGGQAMAEGIEATLQKKLATDFYGTVNATFFRARYRDLAGGWRNRLYDNRYIFSVIGGYRPDRSWEFSARFVYAGGIPYTPFDAARSSEAGTGILDGSQVQALRQPDYNILDLRVDHRFFFTQSSLVAYMSVWNVYNRKNVAAYFWNDYTNRQDTSYQFGLLPIIGLEYEF